MRIIGHGIDIVPVQRIDVMLTEHGTRFTERCFTPDERRYADDSSSRRSERYAARFAAKEAVMKALGTGWRTGITWRDIEVRIEPSGQPALALTGRCEQAAREQGIHSWHVSLSHAGGMAVASVIACG